MKLIISALFVLLSHNVIAGKFEETCKEIDGRVTESSSITCRNIGITTTASVHKDRNGEIFATMYMDGKILNEEAIASIKKLGKGMGIEYPSDFFDSIRARKPSERVGFQFKNMYVFWRTAHDTGAIDKSGFVIYETDDEFPVGTIRCFAAGCRELPVAKWYGPTKDLKNKEKN